MGLMQTHSRPINHIGISVEDIEAFTSWYTDNLGFELIGGKIIHARRSETPSAPIFAIYGQSLKEVKIAFMTTGNGVGFEVFQFIDPAFVAAASDPAVGEFAYHRGGLFHICVTDKNPDALADRIVAAGGSRMGTTVQLVGGIVCLYAKDPWGNVVEVLDHSFERLTTLGTQ